MIFRLIKWGLILIVIIIILYYLYTGVNIILDAIIGGI
jgi:hypothetical protein